MTTDHMVVTLLAYILGRELVFWHQINKMTNKLMSRDFHDYKFSQTAGKRSDVDNAPLEMDPAVIQYTNEANARASEFL